MEISEEFTLVKLQQGKIMHQEVDAVVNFIYPEGHVRDFDGVLAAAGQGIATEYENKSYKDNRLVRRGVVVTATGNLPCKKIFHVNVTNHVAKMKDALNTALRHADREAIRSLAIPELRNEFYQAPAGDEETERHQVASTLADILGISSPDFLEIITDFGKIESPLCLREIKVLVPVSSLDVKKRQANSDLHGFGDIRDKTGVLECIHGSQDNIGDGYSRYFFY